MTFFVFPDFENIVQMQDSVLKLILFQYIINIHQYSRVCAKGKLWQI